MGTQYYKITKYPYKLGHVSDTPSVMCRIRMCNA